MMVMKREEKVVGEGERSSVFAWESLPSCDLRVPICPAEISARQIGTTDKIR